MSCKYFMAPLTVMVLRGSVCSVFGGGGVSSDHATDRGKPNVPRYKSKILFSEATLEAETEGAEGALLEVKYLLRRRDMLDSSNHQRPRDQFGAGAAGRQQMG